MLAKRCARCSAVKPVAEFAPRKGRKDGLYSYCRPCEREYMRQYKTANAERIRELNRASAKRCAPQKAAYNKRWRDENRERMAFLVKRWGENNPDKRAAIEKRYRELHPEVRRLANERRRVSGRRRADNIRRRSKASSISGQLLTARFEYYGWRCRYCSTELTVETVQADHRIPVARGGLSVPANIVPSCAPCNRKKWTRTESEYLAVSA